MEDNINKIEGLIDNATEYGKSSLELIKLKAIDEFSSGVASLIPVIVAILFGASFLLFLNLGIAFWLGDILGKTFFGFFIVGGFYIIITLIFGVFFRKKIKSKFNDFLVKSIFKSINKSENQKE